MRLWRHDNTTPEGKYPLTIRRDGTILTTPYFTMTLIDPCAPAALRAYADEAQRRHLDPAYVQDLRDLAVEAEQLQEHWVGDPDAPRHRVDDASVLGLALAVGNPGGAHRYGDGSIALAVDAVNAVKDALAIVATLSELAREGDTFVVNGCRGLSLRGAMDAAILAKGKKGDGRN